MKFFSSNVDSLPNKLSELYFCMITEEVYVAAIMKVVPKNPLPALLPDESEIIGY